MSGFLLGALGYGAAITVSSPVAAVACLALASGAHDMTLPGLVGNHAPMRAAGSAAPSSGFVNFASCLSGMRRPGVGRAARRIFGSFHAVFYAAAAMYLIGARSGCIIDPRKSIDS